MEQRRAREQAAHGAALGLASVAELVGRLQAGATVRAGLGAGPAAHTGVTVPTGAARVLAVTLAVPFLVIAVALAAPSGPAPVVGNVSAPAGASGDTRTQAVVVAYESGLVVPGGAERCP